jgi:hypothetical protein
MEDKEFIRLLNEFKISCEYYVFEDFKKENKLNFYSLLFDKLEKAIEIKSQLDILNLVILLYQDFPDSDVNMENLIGNRVVFSFDKNINSLKEIKIQGIDFKILFNYIDLFFHNPHFVDYLSKNKRDVFITNALTLLYVKGERSKPSGDYYLMIEYLITVLSYFEDEFTDKHKKLFLEHSDSEIRDLAKEELD